MANEMRDKLFELLTDCEIEYAQYLSEECDKAIKGDVTKQLFKRLEFYADRLIENGVIVPPCKVGDTVYMSFEGEIIPLLITRILTIETVGEFSRCYDATGKSVATSFSDKHIGKTMFLTKEEAEQKLKEMRGGNESI